MSLYNPSDFNGDGKTNYVDYQIYKNYIDPKTANQTSNYGGSGGSFSGIVIIAVIVVFILGWIGQTVSEIGADGLFFVIFGTIGFMFVFWGIYRLCTLFSRKKAAAAQKRQEKEKQEWDNICKNYHFLCPYCGAEMTPSIDEESCPRCTYFGEPKITPIINSSVYINKNGYVETERDREIVKSGGWQCSNCGRGNFNYQMSCVCGHKRSDG